ncbi:MAG: pyridoxamine 5'-phosphate oxidase [Myxococcota bacterium]
MAVDDPIGRFRASLERVREQEPLEGTACVLATADARGRPSARYLLLKEASADGFVFFTNYGSRKASELEHNPYAALCFHWPSVQEQVRLEGTVERVPPEASDAYFASRPRDSQLGAWASRQSEPVASRDALEAAMDEVRTRFEGVPVPRPSYWGGYRLVPDRIEFWYGRSHRLHDRLLYTRTAGGWSCERLAP